MKNIFKFLRDKTAKIIVCDNIITIEREDGQIAVFEGNKDNYCVEYNTGNLGGGIYGKRATNVEIDLGDFGKSAVFYVKGKKVERNLIDGKFVEKMHCGDAIFIEIKA